MDIIEELTGAIKTSCDIWDKLNRLKHLDITLNAKEQVLEVREALMSAKHEVLTLKNRCTDLEEENRQLHQTNADLKIRFEKSAEYEQRELAPGSFAHIEKGAGNDLRHEVKLCSRCFYKGEYSEFSFEKEEVEFDTFRCCDCGNRIRVPNEVSGKSSFACGVIVHD